METTPFLPYVMPYIISYALYNCQEYFIKTNLKVGDEIYVIGIPKGYVDKNNLRQNYIHVLELNGIEIKKEPINEYWNGQKVEIRPPTVNELKEFDELLKDFM